MTKIKAKIKAGDKVYIIKGKDNGKKAIVEKVFIADQKLIVKGINLAKKHIKPKGQQPGSIITLEKPIAIANVQIICPSCNKRTRIGYEIVGKEKQRVCKKCGQVIELSKSVDKKSKTKK
jgi:large subunit ribosomal protein L24